LGLDRERLAAAVTAWTGRVRAAFDHPPEGEAGEFLPDFCHGRTLLRVVLLAEMLALVVTLVTRRLSPSLFTDLFLISLFVQWIALASTALLCLARKRLAPLPPARALAAAFLLLLAVTVLISEATVWILWFAGRIPGPRPEWYAYFHVQNFTVAAVIDALALNYLLAMHRLRQRTQSEARARLQAVRARLRPHFLFNTLNIIASLTRTAPSRAEAAIEDMADLARLMLADDESLVPVRREIEVTRKYVDIERLRLEGRFDVEWDIGRLPRTAVIPILTLQPLLEYLVQTGIETRAQGGRIQLALWEEAGELRIRASGPDGAPVAADETSLNDLRTRLASHYNNVARMDIALKEGQRIVSVALPERGEQP